MVRSQAKASVCSSSVIKSDDTKIIQCLGVSANEGTGMKDDQQWTQDVEFLRAIVDDCVINHKGEPDDDHTPSGPSCKPRDNLPLPSMFIQVSGTDMSPSVRLMEVSRIPSRPIHYACSSYCWGGPQPAMTTTSLVSSYLTQIDTAAIPETVLDAIRVTIRLGLEYLWVGAFCIVQDSGTEKVAELAKMSFIYTGAFCTISVMSAQAATTGFLSRPSGNKTNTDTHHVTLREPESQKSIVIEARSEVSKTDLWDEPLMTRGWTYQEAALSLRLLMFFSSGQKSSFRCSKGTYRSDGGFVSQIPKSLACFQVLVANIRFDYTPHSPIKEWTKIVEEFTHRSITFEGDKLPALMGIATEWAAHFGRDKLQGRIKPFGKNCTGLWYSTLIKELLWRAPPMSPRAAYNSYVAPSWSWHHGHTR